ncbi:hypothetical protein HGO97_016990 [Faecalicatena sp. AGMB00832]|uniref:C-deglycosylation enzyme beta subunit n=1 Tax=Faecalicatena faecalis TaxID=2726362 RepID=A0ABS6D7K2_9FIRM|nr:DUF6379 domain-containing protein [Faecalicatena faecalis]MBU3877501.1 hypothetical protein [Faecalicatena faecalis]
MAGRQIYNPDGFKNIEADGKTVGYQFEFKAQYYRGITLSIVRDIKINVDGEDVKREDIRFTVNNETFTLEEMRTVIDSDYRWEFGDYATVSVMKEGGLSKGNHHIHAVQVIDPSYMPFTIEAVCEADFTIE